MFLSEVKKASADWSKASAEYSKRLARPAIKAPLKRILQVFSLFSIRSRHMMGWVGAAAIAFRARSCPRILMQNLFELGLPSSPMLR
jgi:hypothetical protein